MACDRCNCDFSFWTIFCPYTTLPAQKMKISQKWKKTLELSSFNTSVPKIMIICCTVPETWRVTDVVVIFHFGLFFTLLPPPLKAWKIKISKKWKKSPEDIIILQKSTINDNHKMYGSWDMKCNRHFFLAFCAISCPFTPITAQKMKISKSPLGHIIILHKCTKSHDHRLHCSWDKLHDRYNCHFSFCAIFCPFTCITAQKMKI